MPLRPTLALLLALAACGTPAKGTPDAGPPKPRVVTAESFEDDYLDALCDARVRCRELPDAKACTDFNLYGHRRSSFNGPQAILASVRARRLAYRPADALACLEAVRSQYCSLVGTVLELDDLCRDIFIGSVALGARCIDDLECIEGTSCVRSPGTSCDGVCTALPQDACRRHADCGPDRACENNKCVAVRPAGREGEACGVPTACAAGLVRLRETDPETRKPRCTCVPPPKAGEKCTPLAPCATPELVCVAEGTKAATCAPVAHEGEACSRPGECGPPWSGLGCDTEAKKCRKLPDSGPCLVEGGAAICDPHAALCGRATAKCEPLRHAGESCTSDRDCERPWELACESVDGGRQCVPPTATEACAP